MELEIGVWLSPKAEATHLEGPFCSYRMVLWGLPTGSTQSLSLGAPLIPACNSPVSVYTWIWFTI